MPSKQKFTLVGSRCTGSPFSALWGIYTVNTIDVRKDYVPQETPQGTADNPFAYTPGMKLVPNAFYVLDGVRKVWTGAYGVTAAWDDAGFEVM